VRKTVRYTLTDYKINKEMAKELNITPVLEKIQECRRNSVRHVNRMPHNSLPRMIRNHSPGAEGTRGDN
jgi:FixJ family two-component response regulator